MKVLRWVFEDWGQKDTWWLKIAIGLVISVILGALVLNQWLAVFL